MKINIKQNYKEFLEHIHFPSLIYYYETNRILGMNQLAKVILGENKRNIKDVFNHRPKYTKTTLTNGSLILYKQEVNSDLGVVVVDMEINVVALDEKHMCIVFFEYAYKQNFSKHLMSEVPRIYWKNKEQLYLGMNDSFKKDFRITLTNEELQNKSIKNAFFMEKEVNSIVDVEEMRIIKGREFLYEVLHVIKTNYNESVFILNNRIPFFNKNGTVLGLLGVYHLLLDKEDQKGQYNIALKENYEMYEEQVNLNLLLSEFLEMIQSNIDYNLVFGIIFDTLAKRYNINHMNIYKYYSKEKKVECIYSWFDRKTIKIGKNIDETLGDVRNIIFREMRKNKYIVVNSGEQQEKFKKLLKYNNMKALILFHFSIGTDDKVIISFGDSKERVWSLELITLLRDVTHLFQIAMEKHTLEQEIKELKSKKN